MNILKNNLFKSYYYILGWGILFLCLGLSSWLGLNIPKIINELYENYHNHNEFFKWWRALLFIFLGEYLVRVIYQVTINKLLQYILQNIRENIFSLWLRSYSLNKSKKETEYTMGDILARIMSDTEAIKELITSGSFAIIIDLFFIISCFLGFIELNRYIGFSFMGIEIVICLLLIWGSQFMGKIYMSVRSSMAMMSRVLTNLIEGVDQAYHTADNDYALKRGEKSFDDFLEKQLRANVWDASYYSISESLFPLCLMILVIIIPYSGLRELALVAVIIDLLQRSISPIKEVAGKISSLQRAMAGVKRLDSFEKDLLSRPYKKEEDIYPLSPLQKFTLKVESFRYEGEKRDFEIRDFFLEGLAGDVIGIIGKSGSGKSTLLKIMTGELIPEKFEIEFVGKKEKFIINSDDKKDLLAYRQQMSLISQESHIFSDTIRFNISLGERPDEVDEFWHKVREKLPYLKEWEKTLDDKVTPKDLSLGQKQLLSSLRSCYLSRPIVLLDEISSALDASLELSLRMLTKMIQEKSLVIVVAHRVETLIDAKQIILMDKGEVIAAGRHHELESSSKLYQDFLRHLGRI